MHPEIRQAHPGNCSKCDMTLEPVLPGLDDAGDPELVDFKHRFWWTLLGQIPELKARSQTSAAIENLREIDTLIVDKTGTLTEGRPPFERAIGTAGKTEDDVLRLAASLDHGSEHPLAAASVSAARERGLALGKPEQFDSASGIGVRAVGGKALALGNTALMEQLGVDVSPLAAQAETLRTQGASVMHLAVDAKLAGLLAVFDPFKVTKITDASRGGARHSSSRGGHFGKRAKTLVVPRVPRTREARTRWRVLQHS
jgi:hypothetical protein